MDDRFKSAWQSLLGRPADSHKYDFGHVLIAGGSPGMVGAPLLAAMAALRTGAGLVTIASPSQVIDKLEKRVLEVMTLRLPDQTEAAAKTLDDFIASRKVSALAVGPGLDPGQAGLVKTLLGSLAIPVILDAGGFAAYNGHLADLGQVGQRADLTLTPHQGEFARLAGKAIPKNDEAINQMAADAAKTTHTTLVLKGPHTLVAAPDGSTYINDSGNPGLATAGTGDVLTGIIAALRSQGLNPFQAAACGVYLHGLAGDLAAADKTEPGMIASDVIDSIPAALKQIESSFS